MNHVIRAKGLEPDMTKINFLPGTRRFKLIRTFIILMAASDIWQLL